MTRYTGASSLVLLCCVTVSIAHAQSFAVDRKVWQVGGSASFTNSGSTSGSTDGRRTSFSLAPRLAYFVLPGLAIGASGLLGYASTSSSHSNTYGVGPEVTYYFGRSQRRFYPYVGASVSLQWTSGEYTPSFDPTMTIKTSYRAQVYDARAGIAAMVARNVAVTGALYYAEYHYRQAIGVDAYRSGENAYGADFGVALFLY